MDCLTFISLLCRIVGAFPHLGKWLGAFKDHPTLGGARVPSANAPTVGFPAPVIDLSGAGPPVKKMKKEKVPHPSTLEPLLQMVPPKGTRAELRAHNERQEQADAAEVIITKVVEAGKQESIASRADLTEVMKIMMSGFQETMAQPMAHFASMFATPAPPPRVPAPSSSHPTVPYNATNSASHPPYFPQAHFGVPMQSLYVPTHLHFPDPRHGMPPPMHNVPPPPLYNGAPPPTNNVAPPPIYNGAPPPLHNGAPPPQVNVVPSLFSDVL
jgi:hypothetical protein